METGGDVVDIVRRTQTVLEAAGAERLPVLEQSSGQSCHFPSLTFNVGQGATLSSAMVVAPAAQFPPSTLQSPSLSVSNTPMEGLVAAASPY
eukprot:305459-Rhodomonas_salina.1